MNKEWLPLLLTISEQQAEISKRLRGLIAVLKEPREPPGPALEEILRPLSVQLSKLSHLVEPSENAAD